MRYLVIVEPAGDSYAAFAPDLPGCVAAGDTVEETLDLMREAVQLHLAGMREDGDPIPAPRATAATVEVALEPVGAP